MPKILGNVGSNLSTDDIDITITYRDCISTPLYIAEKILLDNSIKGYAKAYQWGPLLIFGLINQLHENFASTTLSYYKDRVVSDLVNPVMKYFIVVGGYYGILYKFSSIDNKEKLKLLEGISNVSKSVKITDPNSLSYRLSSSSNDWLLKAKSLVRDGSKTVAVSSFDIGKVNPVESTDTFLEEMIIKYPFEILENAKFYTVDGNYENDNMPSSVTKLILMENKNPSVQYFLNAWYYNEKNKFNTSVSIAKESSIDKSENDKITKLTSDFTIALNRLNNRPEKILAFEAIMNQLTDLMGEEDIDEDTTIRSRIKDIFEENKDLI